MNKSASLTRGECQQKMASDETPVKRISNTIVSPFQSEKGQKLYLLKNLSTGEFVLANEKSLFIWSLLDGKNKISDVQAKYEKEFGKVIEQKIVKGFFDRLDKVHLIESQSLEKPQEEKAKSTKRSVFVFSIPLLKPPHLRKAYLAISSLFKRRVLYGFLVFNIVLCFFSVPAFLQYLLERNTFVFFGWVLIGQLIFIASVYPLIAILHELAHALTFLHFQFSPTEVGLRMRYTAVSFYTDAKDSWLLPRKTRMLSAIAGPLFTIFMGNCLFLAIQLTTYTFVRKYLILLFFGCFFLTLASLNPLRKSDCYFFLVDLLNIPNLSSKFRSFAKDFGKRKSEQRSENARKFAVYGFLVVSYYIAFSFVSLVILSYIVEDLLKLMGLSWPI